MESIAKFIGISFLVFIGSCFTFAIYNKLNRTDSANSTSTDKGKDLDVEATVANMFVHYLKQAQRDPDSFVLELALVTTDRTTCVIYRGRNGFGGMNRERVVQSVKDDKSFVIGESEPGFASLWNKRCSAKTGRDLTNVINLSLR